MRHRVTKRVDRWRQLSKSERRLLLRSAVLVAAVRSSLWMLPMRVARRNACFAARGVGIDSVEKLAWAVSAAARYFPRATCLTQALALEALLAQAGHECRVEIGVAKQQTAGFQAHAWVVHDGAIILGGEEAPAYSAILASSE